MRRSAWPMLKIVITQPDCWLRSSLALSSSRTNLHVIIIQIFQTSLRNILGTKNLHEILSDRESIALAMQVVKISDMDGWCTWMINIWCVGGWMSRVLFNWNMPVSLVWFSCLYVYDCRAFWTMPRWPGESKWRESKCERLTSACMITDS